MRCREKTAMMQPTKMIKSIGSWRCELKLSGWQRIDHRDWVYLAKRAFGGWQDGDGGD